MTLQQLAEVIALTIQGRPAAAGLAVVLPDGSPVVSLDIGVDRIVVRAVLPRLPG